MNQYQQNLDFDFNTLNQQMEVRRIQDQGQLVVSASNNANLNQMTGFPGNVEPSLNVTSKHRRSTTPTATNTDSQRILTPQPDHALSHLQQAHHLQQQQTNMPAMGPVEVTPQEMHAIRRKLPSQHRNYVYGK